MEDLSERDRELLLGLIGLEDQNEPFEIGANEDGLDDDRWPSLVPKPNREEIRQLGLRGFLETDQGARGTWQFWLSAKTRDQFGDEEMRTRTAALRNPDERLGVILDAVVEAFEVDPSEPLLIFGTGLGSVVRHPCWGIEPDVVKKHDLSQLEMLGFIAWESDTAFFPTPNGRMASASPALFLTRTAEEVADDDESSRLRSTAEKLRAGDIAVGAAGSFTGLVIRALLGIE